ncbi:nucleoside hydrolase [Kineococcus sp. SYSU DK001]|uniref:nucleoside hydrolase n=1 Tax=Kineococcus sp. SYSU DK001 TaxID=3383122 RepID=UPI003D7F04A5
MNPPTPSPFPVSPRCRVIVDNDFSGDPDGLVGLAHHLLSPANRVVLITSSFLHPMFGSPVARAADGARMARELLDVVGPGTAVPVAAGCDHARGAGDTASAAADAIVAEARREDDLPLLLVCAGPLTNVAQALEQAPDTAGRLTLVWVGGSLDPAAGEYNRDTDPESARFVLEHPELPVWQFPLETYRQCGCSVAELEHDLAGSGAVGRWLWERFVDLAASMPDFLHVPSVWPLGDSVPLLVTGLDDGATGFEAAEATPGRGPRRVHTRVDARLVIGDMLARLRLHEARRAR